MQGVRWKAAVFGLFLFCVGCGHQAPSESVSPVVIVLPEDGASNASDCDAVVSWLSWFVEGDFEKCDGYVKNVNYMLSGGDGEEIYRKLAGAVKEVVVSDWWDEDGDVWCNITVTLQQFEPMDGYQFPDGYLEDIRGSYMRGELSADDFQHELELVYKEIWDTGVFRLSDGEQSVFYQLLQRDGYVSGTEYMVESMLVESGLLSNLIYYSENVQDMVAGAIK